MTLNDYNLFLEFLIAHVMCQENHLFFHKLTWTPWFYYSGRVFSATFLDGVEAHIRMVIKDGWTIGHGLILTGTACSFLCVRDPMWAPPFTGASLLPTTRQNFMCKQPSLESTYRQTDICLPKHWQFVGKTVRSKNHTQTFLNNHIENKIRYTHTHIYIYM